MINSTKKKINNAQRTKEEKIMENKEFYTRIVRKLLEEKTLQETIYVTIPFEDTQGVTVQYNRKILLPFLIKVLKNSGWKKEGYMGDYSFSNKEIWLARLYNCFGVDSSQYMNIKNKVKEDLVPREYIEILLKNWNQLWEIYNINEVIEFCIGLADGIEDTIENRKEYLALYEQMFEKPMNEELTR